MPEKLTAARLTVDRPSADWLGGDPAWSSPASLAMAASMRDRPVLAQLAEHVQRQPGRTALEDHDHTLSFAGLSHRVAQIAATIHAAHIDANLGRHGPIAVLLPGDVTFLPAVLACFALGRPCVPPDTTVPAARNADLLHQTGASVVIVPAAAAAIAPEGVLQIPMPVAPLQATEELVAALPTPVSIDAPALILCTSGSTGRPKAIVHSQRTIMHRAWSHRSAIDPAPGDLCLALSPPTTIAGLIGLLAFLAAGGATRFLDMRQQGIAGLLDTMQARPVRFLRASPSALRILTTLPEAPAAMARLRNVTTYGEPVLRADITAIRACLPPAATIFAGYGSTESSGMGWYPSGDDRFDPIRTPAGRVYPGVEAMILNDDGHPCPPDEPGELVIRSRYNALGEWQDGHCVPGQLIPDPVDPTLRTHRTGDLAWRSTAAVFTVLGRIDRMLKVNGQRIEPAEIEAAIRRAPGIADCAVVAQSRGTQTGITAFIVLTQDAPPATLETLRATLRSELPAAMVPSRFIPIAALPMLPGGKVDYMTLKGPAPP